MKHENSDSATCDVVVRATPPNKQWRQWNYYRVPFPELIKLLAGLHGLQEAQEMVDDGLVSRFRKIKAKRITGQK